MPLHHAVAGVLLLIPQAEGTCLQLLIRSYAALSHHGVCLIALPFLSHGR